MSSPILVTGAAGFIGYHMVERLLAEGRQVVGVDSFTPYYDVALKEARFARLSPYNTFLGERLDLADAQATRDLFRHHRFERVIHLAAQPGVRFVDPQPYAASNLLGFMNVLEACRQESVGHLVYASSSSVYGANRTLPFSEHDTTDHPISLYAATKKANEMMAHSYAHLFGLPCTGLRFFTVYGPWGRPDMAVYKFTHAIAEGREIQVANGGRVRRDFTYVDDIVEGIVRLVDRAPSPDPAWNAQKPDPATSAAPHRVYNIGNDSPEEVNRLIALIEEQLGRKARRVDVPLPPGDVLETRADVTDLRRDVGFAPATPLEEGIRRFVAWYRGYHGA
ncbi:NAD-dependent epimerase/dehydratase family protein [Microvirga arsenatis]|uniref:NAD-dependent epimerase/dehydratase family protein n=1 Tax=Microvirga arsenatis TaxID=2692265 RepID=A0ABW9YW12_9HYPH|nr:NAD-dependent epimerase/dehydratase family protein [Microvirga arsenatis]NBJ13552.1 NAD-dependent epimerase/dehydratase family protein [Microvirga arsenatis]NBJ23861.1 NAD-dependent epimerase/dehydratase family protein [Microvirga arsenatis]